MITMEEVFTYDNLLAGYYHVRKGKRHKKNAIDYGRKVYENLHVLQKRILAGKYRPKAIFSFVVYEPKERFITANYFEDKIVQYVLTEYALKPLIQPKLIHDNYASQDGKGSKLAIDRLEKFLYQFSKETNWTNEGYVLTCDIKKFFYMIDQTIAISMINKLKMDKTLKGMVSNQIRAYGYKFNQYTDEENRGICIGFQTSQWIAVYYLSGLDHFIKEKLKIKYYGRYMDDFYLIHKGKEYLEHCMEEIRRYVEDKLHLSLNKKTHIHPINQGVCFIGYRAELNEKTHKVDIHVRRKSVKREWKRLRKQVKRMDDMVSLCKTVESMTSWYSYAKRSTDDYITSTYKAMFKYVANNSQGILQEIDPVKEYNEKVYELSGYSPLSLKYANFQLDISSRCELELPDNQ